MGRLRRSRAVWRRGTPHAACRTSHLHDGCTGGGARAVGTIVVHVLVFDYRTLPFISSQSPYFEVFGPVEGGAPREGTTGSEVEVAIYGWGLAAVYTSTACSRLVDQRRSVLADLRPVRRPFWTTIHTNDGRYHVFFSNDRVFIYAIGYKTLTPFDHLVHLAELTTLSGGFYLLVLLATGIFTRVARARPRLGRALLREIRASFYRKLFLAFVLAVDDSGSDSGGRHPLVLRESRCRRCGAEAARTAAVAQRVIEQSNALMRRGRRGSSPRATTS